MAPSPVTHYKSTPLCGVDENFLSTLVLSNHLLLDKSSWFISKSSFSTIPKYIASSQV